MGYIIIIIFAAHNSFLQLVFYVHPTVLQKGQKYILICYNLCNAMCKGVGERERERHTHTDTDREREN